MVLKHSSTSVKRKKGRKASSEALQSEPILSHIKDSNYKIVSLLLVLLLSGINIFTQNGDLQDLQNKILMSEPFSINLLRTVPVDLPKHTSRAKCGEVLPELQDNLEVVTNLLDIIRKNAAHAPKHSINYNPVSHSKGDVQTLLLKQSCLYDILVSWNQLTTDLRISRWVVHGGSSIGAKCNGGLNP